MAESVTVLCPNLTCRAVLNVPARVRGKRIRCGRCGSCFTVPQNAGKLPGMKTESAPIKSTGPAGPTVL